MTHLQSFPPISTREIEEQTMTPTLFSLNLLEIRGLTLFVSCTACELPKVIPKQMSTVKGSEGS